MDLPLKRPVGIVRLASHRLTDVRRTGERYSRHKGRDMFKRVRLSQTAPEFNHSDFAGLEPKQRAELVSTLNALSVQASEARKVLGDASRSLQDERSDVSDHRVPVRALVVDDHVDVAHALCELLELFGCKTAAAFGGITGARFAELFRPEIVFMDFGMPDLDGEGALARIRQAGRVNAIFVCMTGRDDPALRQRSFDAGFHHFLTKPVEPQMFEQLIEHVYRVRRGLNTQSNPAWSNASGRPDECPAKAAEKTRPT